MKYLGQKNLKAILEIDIPGPIGLNWHELLKASDLPVETKIDLPPEYGDPSGFVRRTGILLWADLGIPATTSWDAVRNQSVLSLLLPATIPNFDRLIFMIDSALAKGGGKGVTAT